ncbi:MAG: ABC transporter substrate-binding protein [Oscillospiraceae bacterium]
MFDNPRDAFAIAESMLDYSYNTEDAQELKNAADLLATQKPVLQAYVMDQIFDKLERGEAWAAPYYAGDYLTMVEENPDLAFSFPEEGFNIFIDAMCIPKGCQNKEGAGKRSSTSSAVRMFRPRTWTTSVTPRRRQPRRSTWTKRSLKAPSPTPTTRRLRAANRLQSSALRQHRP